MTGPTFSLHLQKVFSIHRQWSPALTRSRSKSDDVHRVDIEGVFAYQDFRVSCSSNAFEGSHSPIAGYSSIAVRIAMLDPESAARIASRS